MADKKPDERQVECPRCGGDGGDRYLCWFCEGQGMVSKDIAAQWRGDIAKRLGEPLKEK